MSARDDHAARVMAGVSEPMCWAALFDEIDRLRDDDLFNLIGTWYVRHADGTTEDIELTHGNLVENSVGTCGQFILRRATP